MSFEASFFAKKRVVFDRLLAAGFSKEAGDYLYRETFMNGDFQAEIRITETGQVTGRVFDSDLGEEYLALRVKGQKGGFVGQVREAYGRILERLATTCFEAQPFSHEQSNWLARRIETEWGDTYDRPFAKFSDYVSYRIKGKWYALIFPIKLGKLTGLSGEIAERETEVVNLKVDPSKIEVLLAKDGVYPSYHMSKKSWVSVVLDGSLTNAELWDLVVKSRYLADPRPLSNAEGPDYWLIPANPKYYDIDAELAENRVTSWPQKASIKKGDYIGIYITAPAQTLRYLCRVLEAEVQRNRKAADGGPERRMTVELIKTFGDGEFDINRLKEHGVTNIRGPRRMTKPLAEVVRETLGDSQEI